MRCNLWTHPKVVSLSSAIDRTLVQTIGALHGAWSIADQHADEVGHVEMSASALDKLVDTPGFCDGMSTIGWLIVGDQSLQFVSYQEHNGTTAKRRAEDSKRKQEARDLLDPRLRLL